MNRNHRINQKNKLPQSAEEFLSYLVTIKNSSEGTIDGYRSNLKLFFDFIKEYKKVRSIKNKTIKDIKLTDLYAFLNYTEKELDNSPATRARKVSCLKSYFHYLYKIAKIVSKNIAEELDQIKIPKTKPITLDVQQSKQLLNACDVGALFYTRDKCILNIFLQCGLKLSELCNIKLNDIKDNKITIISKGSKPRYAFLSESCIKAINEYLAERKDENASDVDKEYLFLSKQQKKIGIQAIQNLVKKHLKEAGLTDQNYNTNSLRSSFATVMYQNGNNLRVVQELLGLSCISTTDIYSIIDVDDDMLIKAVCDNPLNKEGL